MSHETSMIRGIGFSIASSALFATMYYYATLLAPLNGKEVFGWRALLTLPCVTLFMIVGREWCHVVKLVGRIRRAPILVLGLFVSSALLGLQQWLFLWAPINGRGLQVSLGYLLLPLTMLLVGRLFYRERLSRLQNTAAVCAALGVTHELYSAGSLSWATMLVALGFPMYFVLRRRLETDHLGGLWFDMLFMLPLAAVFVFERLAAHQLQIVPELYSKLAVLAVISATAFMCWISAARVLSLGLFGLLGYVEPILMVGVALMIGERIQAEQWMTYFLIWVAISVLILDGVLHTRRSGLREGANN